MNRRTLLALIGGVAIVTGSRAALSQRKRIFRIGYLAGGSLHSSLGLMDRFEQNMSELGYVVDRDFVVEWRFADFDYSRFVEYANELVKMDVDVIVAGTRMAVEAAQKATTKIPIVLTMTVDPVAAGYVSSLARPGGNITGVAGANERTVLKQFDLLRLLVPKLSMVAYLVNPTRMPAHGMSQPGIPKELDDGAKAAGSSILRLEIREPADIKTAFDKINSEKIRAVMMNSTPLMNSHSSVIAELCLASKVASVAQRREYAEAGGLLSYGESGAEFTKRAASFVDRILKGAKPAELPVELATRLNLAINRKTATALGIEIPPQLIAAADDVFD